MSEPENKKPSSGILVGGTAPSEAKLRMLEAEGIIKIIDDVKTESLTQKPVIIPPITAAPRKTAKLKSKKNLSEIKANLGKNYWESGYTAYRKGDLEGAEKYLVQSIQAAPKSEWAEEAQKLLGNISISQQSGQQVRRPQQTIAWAGQADKDFNGRVNRPEQAEGQKILEQNLGFITGALQDRTKAAQAKSIVKGIQSDNWKIEQQQKQYLERGRQLIDEGREVEATEYLRKARKAESEIQKRGGQITKTSGKEDYIQTLDRLEADNRRNITLQKQLGDLQQHAQEITQARPTAGRRAYNRASLLTSELAKEAEKEKLEVDQAVRLGLDDNSKTIFSLGPNGLPGGGRAGSTAYNYGGFDSQDGVDRAGRQSLSDSNRTLEQQIRVLGNAISNVKSQTANEEINAPEMGLEADDITNFRGRLNDEKPVKKDQIGIAVTDGFNVTYRTVDFDRGFGGFALSDLKNSPNWQRMSGEQRERALQLNEQNKQGKLAPRRSQGKNSSGSSPLFTNMPGVISIGGAGDIGAAIDKDILRFDSSVYDPDDTDGDLNWSFVENKLPPRLLERITIQNLTATDLFEFLESLSLISGLNFEVDRGISAKVQANFEDKTLAAILNSVLTPIGLTWKLQGSTVYVSPNLVSVSYSISPEDIPKVNRMLERGLVQKILWGKSTPGIEDISLYLDQVNGRLILNDSQHNQDKVAEILAKFRAGERNELIFKEFKIAAPSLAPKIKSLLDAVLRAHAGAGYVGREIFQEGNKIIVKDTRDNIQRAEQLMRDRSFVTDIEAGRLDVATFNLAPREVLRLKDTDREKFAAKVEEVTKTILYSDTGMREAREKGRKIWFDKETMQLTITDYSTNIRKVADYINSLKEISSRQRSKIIFLKYANANEVAERLEQNSDLNIVEGDDAGDKISYDAFGDLNAIMVRYDDAGLFAESLDLIDKYDRPTTEISGGTKSAVQKAVEESKQILQASEKIADQEANLDDTVLSAQIKQLDTLGTNYLDAYGLNVSGEISELKRNLKQARFNARDAEKNRQQAKALAFDVTDIIGSNASGNDIALQNFLYSNSYFDPAALQAFNNDTININNGTAYAANFGKNPERFYEAFNSLRMNEGKVISTTGKNIALSNASEFPVIGSAFQGNQTAQGTNYAILDDAQLKTLYDLNRGFGDKELQSQLDNDKVKGQQNIDFIVGTRNKIAGLGLTNSYTNIETNGFVFQDTEIKVPHDHYLAIDNGDYLTIIKAGQSRNWLERGEIPLLPQDEHLAINLPIIGQAVHFEKTILDAGESPDVVIDYKYKRKK